MTYATVADLEARFGADEIAELCAAPGRCEAALADARAEVDAVLGAERYLPLPAGRVFPQLTRVACDLARARLYDDAELEAPRRMAKQCRDWLAALSNDAVRIVDADGRPHERVAVARRTGPEPAFADDELAGL